MKLQDNPYLNADQSLPALVRQLTTLWRQLVTAVNALLDAQAISMSGNWQWAPGIASPSWGQLSAGGVVTNPALATTIVFNKHSRGGVDFSGTAKLIASGWTIYAQSAADPDSWAKYSVTGAATPVGTDAASVPVTLVASGPNPVTGWADISILLVAG